MSSGSAGNSTFLQSGDTRILIDQGLSVRTLAARLQQIGETLDGIDALIISHAHGDHSGGVPRTVRELARRGKTLPVYFTRPTAELIDWQGAEKPPVKYFEAGARFEIGDLQIQSLSVLHDCVDPVAFAVTDRRGIKAVVAVDLGSVPDALSFYSRGAQIVLLESNHDSELLRIGSYPEHLKKRITSETGHLSNAACRNWIRREMDPNVCYLILGHLSRQNNLPQIVIDGAEECLMSRGITLRENGNRGDGCTLSIATYQTATPIIEV